MAEKRIVKASDLKKTSPKKTTTTSSKSKLDLGSIKKIIDDNPEAVAKIKEGVTEIITKKVIKKAATGSSKKTTTTKKSSSNDSLSKMMDLAGTLLKK